MGVTITDNRKLTKVEFADLMCGDVFATKDSLYIKTMPLKYVDRFGAVSMSHQKPRNAYCFTHNSHDHVQDNEAVERVNVEIIITEFTR